MKEKKKDTQIRTQKELDLTTSNHLHTLLLLRKKKGGNQSDRIRRGGKKKRKGQQ